MTHQPPAPHASRSPQGDAAAESPSDARERLLDAAERLFAEHGFRAASVRKITLAAGCNLAAVNYHFGSKLNLYREVFARRLRALRERRIAGVRQSLERAGDGATLELLLRSFASSFVEPLIADSSGRQWMKLLSRELIDPRLPPGIFFGEMIVPVEEALSRALVEVCPGLTLVTARLCTQSLVAQLLHAVHLHRYTEEAGPGAGVDHLSLSVLVDHVLRFSTAAVHALARPVGQEEVLGALR